MKTPRLNTLCIAISLLTLSGCSVLKQKNQLKQRLESIFERSSKATIETQHQAAQTSWRLLRKSTNDSLSFTVWVRAEGTYSIHPDSGIRGENARIAVQGRRQRQVSLEGSSSYQRSQESQASISAATSNQQKITQTAQQKEKQTKRYPWLVWIPFAIVIGLLLIWLYRRRM